MNFLDNLNFENFFKLLPSDILNPLSIIGAAIDIIIITFIIYKLITLVQETRAFSLLKGILLIILLAIVSKLLNLRTISFLIDNIFAFAVLAIVIIFQPEIRRALEKLGAGGIKNFFGSYSEEYKIKITSMVEEVVKSCVEMSAQYIGALIVIEKEIKIGEFINTGTKIDSLTSSELIQNIFVPNTPLHDGAIIIREDRIMAASCFLPLTDNPNLSKELGTRHRAALGITEISDCIVIAVSEESGKISYAINGGLVRNLNKDTLRKALLLNLLKESNHKSKNILKGRNGVKKVKK
ncbi:MAG: diadenylate cyclase CdaA [Clostridia bacterium]|nr:diadenylate cyclase CdaA [Clostridia bacterium]